MGLPLQNLLPWQPFRLDALGIVTLLGAEEVNRAVGRFVRSRWLEYMPLLGAFVIAGDRISDDISGNSLYNLSRGSRTTRLSPWFSRLILSQAREIHATNTFIRWTLQPKQRSTGDIFCAILLPLLTCSPLVILAVLANDWWGLTNAAAIVTSILVRAYIVQAHTKSIDDCILAHSSRNSLPPTTEKCLLITPEAKCLAMSIPAAVARAPSPLVADLAPAHALTFGSVQLIGWFAFAAHVISLGMSCLVVQIYTVVLLVIPTILLILRLGCPDSSPWLASMDFGAFWRDKLAQHTRRRTKRQPDHGVTRCTQPDAQFPRERVYRIGSYLQAEILEWPQALRCSVVRNHVSTDVIEPAPDQGRNGKRQHLFAYLQLTQGETESMYRWDMFPHLRERDSVWLSDYELLVEYVERTVRERGIQLPWEEQSEFLPWQKPQA